MKLNGRRESTNVDDRRGMSAGKMGGMGIGGIVIIALITLLSGGNLGDVFNSVVSNTDLLNMNVASAQTVAERMAAFVDACLRADERMKDLLLLIAPPAMDNGMWTDEQSVAESLRLGANYRYVADYYGIRFVDASEWDLPTCRDGVHLTAIGHQLFAEHLRPVLLGEEPQSEGEP